MFRRRERAAARSAEVVPGYADLVEIGGGAFATVYRATEVETGRNVALKILKLETIQPHLVETFGQEIQTLAKVSDHPNIVTLYRPLSTADGRPALVLELCRESLAQRIRRDGPLDARQTVRVGIKIAGALETAHRNGFLHRDMKPQNILVTQFDEPALADFGVAALQASAQTTTGVLGFTTVHAAPEILEGHELSPATDIYGLASSLYQLLTGLAPFAAFENEAPAAVILRILRDPVRPVRSSAVPLELSDLLEAALAKNPERRPPTAARFAEALRDIEEACSWPQTSYVAWGAEPARREPKRVAVPSSLAVPVQPPPPPPIPSIPSPPPPPTIPSPAPRASSSVQSTPVSVQAPPAPVQPARTSVRPLPEQAVPPPPDPPSSLTSELPIAEESTAPALRLHRAPTTEPMATDSGPTEPLSVSLPPPPAPRPGPALLRPEPPARNVVAPGETTRGQPSRPLNRRPDRMPPLTAPTAPSGPDQTDAARTPAAEPRPVFVDPDRDAAFAASAGGAGAESVYEATILPPSGRRATERQAVKTPAPATWRRALAELPPAAMAGIGTAALVVVLALLLIIGVL